MSAPVATPRHVYPTLAALASDLGCRPWALYRYLDEGPRGWSLRPLDEAAYDRWHRTAYARWEAAQAAQEEA
ncbi:MAG TPA: hypothetical protein PKD53_16725 [Chloroflexaceae bacterium]|nr:hypothetical protein [Chloroflexaceae bacterium]